MHGQQKPLSLEHAFSQYTLQSGSGSLVENARPYITFLTTFIAYHEGGIRSIADLGCGDLALMHEVMTGLDHLGCPRPEYLGIDALSRRVEMNRQRHPDLPCEVGDARDLTHNADLVLVKDVLQHWDLASIHQWLVHRPVATYTLITNCARGPNVNGDIVMGDWRALDLSRPPFEICQPLDGPGSIVFSWDTKDVVLLRS